MLLSSGDDTPLFRNPRAQPGCAHSSAGRPPPGFLVARSSRTAEETQMLKTAIIAAAAATLASTAAMAQSSAVFGGCSIPAVKVHQIQSQLANVVTMNNGGLFSPN